ncbi:HotDog domain-containing protein [Lipomyces oligophaga]|uniref:HotDog domain-containing protein n=1 Tax=Lipomyces oligophaga TaxID=45792 RepID=UPI0034CD7810
MSYSLFRSMHGVKLGGSHILAKSSRSIKAQLSTTSPIDSGISAVPLRRGFAEVSTIFIAAASMLAGAALAFKYSPIDLIALMQPKLPEAGSLEEAQYIEKIEAQLQSSPVVKELRKTPGFNERRMWSNLSQSVQDSSFLAGSCKGVGKFAVPGIVFVSRDSNQVVSVVHVGSRLCGFPGIVHGGLLAAILDECLARAAILPLPGHSAVTANLTINYRAPTFADQLLVIESHVTENTDKKSLVSAEIRSPQGVLLAESTGVFVVPKKYKLASLVHM